MLIKPQLVGQSVIEIILALTIFIFIVGGSVAAILGSLSSTRLAKEENQATLFANQGLEATQSIRNQDWANLTTGDHGLTQSGDLWTFTGSSDDPNGEGKFSRVINITNAQRNSEGVLVDSGGITDPNTKIVTATITWNFTPTRSNSVSLINYLTNWQQSRNVPGSGAPTFNTCNEYCVNQGYSAGTCEPVSPPCSNSGGVHKPAADVYCSGGPSSNTCCCMP